MTILRWTVPKRVKTVSQWRESYGFDGGPDGGYQPNMSEADQQSWKAKITGKKLGYPQVEIRKTTQNGSQIVIIVNLGDGYNYKNYCADNFEKVAKMAELYPFYATEEAFTTYMTRMGYDADKCRADYQSLCHPTRGINVHLATNGPILMTFDEMGEMQSAIEEAKQALMSLVNS